MAISCCVVPVPIDVTLAHNIGFSEKEDVVLGAVKWANWPK